MSKTMRRQLWHPLQRRFQNILKLLNIKKREQKRIVKQNEQPKEKFYLMMMMIFKKQREERLEKNLCTEIPRKVRQIKKLIIMIRKNRILYRRENLIFTRIFISTLRRKMTFLMKAITKTNLENTWIKKNSALINSVTN